MIDIFYTTFNEELSQHVLNNYIALLPDDMAIRNSKYRRWQDRHAHLLGKLLLLEGFKKYNIPSKMLGYIEYNDYARPFLKGNIDFNISHSGKFVLCSIGKNVRFGVDIEECVNINFNDFRNVMTEQQWRVIKNSPNPLKTFFKFWTVKESVIKADSRGLSIPLLDIHVNNNIVYYNNHKWYLNEINLSDNYCACLACNKSDVSVNLYEVDYYKNDVCYSNSISNLHCSIKNLNDH